MGSTFDEVLVKHVGEFGKYQIFRALLLVTINLVICLTSMSTVFITENPEHYCEIPQQLASLNCSRKQIEGYSIPITSKDGKEVNDQCHLFGKKYENLTESDVCPNNVINNATNGEKVKCESWTFVTSVYESTVVTEWNLVCDRAWLAKNTAGLYMAARIVGTAVFGWLADRFGRKPIFLIGGIINAGAFTLSAFMPTYTTFIVCKVVEGFVSLGFFSVGYVLVTEMVGPGYRVAVGSMTLLFWGIGYLFLPLIAYFFTEWSNLVITIGGIHFVACVFYLIFIPESPRWLLSRKKNKEALTILRAMAKANGKEPDDVDVSELVIQEETKSTTPVDLVRTPNIRITTFILLFGWFVVSFVYYGIAMNIQDMGGNVYINLLLSAATEIPAALLCWILPRYFGRVILASFLFVASGVTLLLVPAVPVSYDWPVVVLAMSGKFFNLIAFQMLYFLTAEIYSTNIRGLGLTFNSSCARVGATVGVYAGLLIDVHRALPQIVFGLASLVAGIFVMALPETRGVPLSQTVEESEQFVSKNAFAICKQCRKDSARESGQKSKTTDAEESFLADKTVV